MFFRYFSKENCFSTLKSLFSKLDLGGGAFHPPPATDHHTTNTQHKKREFNVFYKKCSFDPADRQASRQFIFPRLFSENNYENELDRYLLSI